MLSKALPRLLFIQGGADEGDADGMTVTEGVATGEVAAAVGAEVALTSLKAAAATAKGTAIGATSLVEANAS